MLFSHFRIYSFAFQSPLNEKRQTAALQQPLILNFDVIYRIGACNLGQKDLFYILLTGDDVINVSICLCVIVQYRIGKNYTLGML